jgi:hypothetical protein
MPEFCYLSTYLLVVIILDVASGGSDDWAKVALESIHLLLENK